MQPDLIPRKAETVLLLAGETLVLHPSGLIWLPDHEALVVSDLHLEKGSSLAQRGQLVPPYDSAATLAALARIIAHFAPRQVVALGDSFHDGGGPQRMDLSDHSILAGLMCGRDWLWIAGNHDPSLEDILPGRHAAETRFGTLTLRHEPLPGAQGEVAGHLHPVAKVAGYGRAVRRRAFAHDGSRLVMPAFGALTGGLNVRDAAFAPLFPRGFSACLCSGDRIFTVADHQCSL